MNSRIKTTLALLTPLVLILGLVGSAQAYEPNWNALFCDITSGTSAQQVYNAVNDYNEDSDDRMCGAGIRFLRPGTHDLANGLKFSNAPATNHAVLAGNTIGTILRRCMSWDTDGTWGDLSAPYCEVSNNTQVVLNFTNYSANNGDCPIWIKANAKIEMSGVRILAPTSKVFCGWGNSGPNIAQDDVRNNPSFVNSLVNVDIDIVGNGGGEQPPQPQDECTNNNECEDDEVCDTAQNPNVCVLEEAPPADECTTNSDCNPDYQCDTSANPNQCVVRPNECANHSDCEDNELCQNNGIRKVCIELTCPSGQMVCNLSSTPYCASSADADDDDAIDACGDLYPNDNDNDGYVDVEFGGNDLCPGTPQTLALRMVAQKKQLKVLKQVGPVSYKKMVIDSPLGGMMAKKVSPLSEIFTKNLKPALVGGVIKYLPNYQTQQQILFLTVAINEECPPYSQCSDIDGDDVGDLCDEDRDGDFLPNDADPNDILADADDDGYCDGPGQPGVSLTCDFNNVDQCPLNPTTHVTPCEGPVDVADGCANSDNDGLCDDYEAGRGCAVGNSDTDGDGTLDGNDIACNDNRCQTEENVINCIEIVTPDPTTGGGTTGGNDDGVVDGSETVTDSDNDGLSDEYESANTTDPNDPDSDNDGLLDGYEILVNFSDPINCDSDDDGICDGSQACEKCSLSAAVDANGLPYDNCVLVNNPDQVNADGDVRGDACQTDYDGDGVADDKDNCKIKKNPDQSINPCEFDSTKAQEELKSDGGGCGCRLGNAPATPLDVLPFLILALPMAAFRVARKRVAK